MSGTKTTKEGTASPSGWFLDASSRQIWATKYRFRRCGNAVDRNVEDTWRRVAHAIAAAEPERSGPQAVRWEDRFYSILSAFRFLPGGRVQAGAGTDREVTLLNCFVMGIPGDSIEGIFRHLAEAALTMQEGGGIGCDFSALRPRGSVARRVGGIASGPVSFMEIWDAACATLLAAGTRRGAMMATLRCDHPDIEEFIEAKRRPGRLRHFNLSVLVSDAFLEAVDGGSSWPLVFPEEIFEGRGPCIERSWSGRSRPVACRIVREIPARALWNKLLRAAYDAAEPGVLFIDRINRMNNLRYCEVISATNPCGEIPLPPYGGCDLGSLNLTSFVRGAFSATARLDLPLLRATARIAARFLDDVIEVSHYPLPAQREAVQRARRIGLGVTGLADALAMLGHRYDSEEGRHCATHAMREIAHAAYRTSVALARERGTFPAFERDPFLASPFVAQLPVDIRDGIARDGIRNSHLTAIAPAGTISLLANNVSSGLEPIFAVRQERQLLAPDGSTSRHSLLDYAYRRWSRQDASAGPLPEELVDAQSLPPRAHLAMQAALQPFVDNAISKTVNVPTTLAFEEFARIYRSAYELGLKGCTTFRPNPITGAVLESASPGWDAPHCCAPEREAD